MNEIDNYMKIKLYLFYENNIDWILKVIILGKVCEIWCKNSNFCYIQWSKPNQIKSPYEEMDKDLHCINSANASSIAEVTLMYCDYDPLCVLINQIIQKFCSFHWKLTPYAACFEQMLWIRKPFFKIYCNQTSH